MKVKPLVKTEDILSVFFKINAQAVVHHRETHKFIFMRSLDRDMIQGQRDLPAKEL